MLEKGWKQEKSLLDSKSDPPEQWVEVEFRTATKLFFFKPAVMCFYGIAVFRDVPMSGLKLYFDIISIIQFFYLFPSMFLVCFSMLYI